VTSAPYNSSTQREQNEVQKLREILTERELSDWLGISQPTLARHRRDKTGPIFVRLSARRVGYIRASVEAWLREQERRAPAHGDVG
jgi:predicted DNA-binding transcriptional regulator AlpA